VTDARCAPFPRGGHRLSLDPEATVTPKATATAKPKTSLASANAGAVLAKARAALRSAKTVASHLVNRAVHFRTMM